MMIHSKKRQESQKCSNKQFPLSYITPIQRETCQKAVHQKQRKLIFSTSTYLEIPVILIYIVGEFSKLPEKGQWFRLFPKQLNLVKNGCLKKEEVSIFFTLTNPFQCYFPLQCAFLYFVHLDQFYEHSGFISHYVIHGKKLVLLNLISRYVPYVSG